MNPIEQAIEVMERVVRGEAVYESGIEALAALKAHQQAAQDVELPLTHLAELAKMHSASFVSPHHFTLSVVALRRIVVDAIEAHQARQAVPQGYVQTVIEALYENGDPVSVDAAELLQSLAAAPTPEATQPPLTAELYCICGAEWRWENREWELLASPIPDEAPEATQPTQAEAPEHCEACNNTGLWHCSDPVNCGGPWDTQAEAPSGVAEWQARVGDRGLWTRIDPPKGETLEQRIQYLLGIRSAGGTPVYQVRALYTHPAPEQVEPPIPADLAALRDFFDLHAVELEDNAYAYCELAYTRQTGWMAWITDKPLAHIVVAPDRKVLAQGQGDTPEEAARDAIDAAREAKKGGEA